MNVKPQTEHIKTGCCSFWNSALVNQSVNQNVWRRFVVGAHRQMPPLWWSPIDAYPLQRGAMMTSIGPSTPWCCPSTSYAVEVKQPPSHYIFKHLTVCYQIMSPTKPFMYKADNFWQCPICWRWRRCFSTTISARSSLAKQYSVYLKDRSVNFCRSRNLGECWASKVVNLSWRWPPGWPIHSMSADFASTRSRLSVRL